MKLNDYVVLTPFKIFFIKSYFLVITDAQLQTLVSILKEVLCAVSNHRDPLVPLEAECGITRKEQVG